MILRTKTFIESSSVGQIIAEAIAHVLAGVVLLAFLAIFRMIAQMHADRERRVR